MNTLTLILIVWMIGCCWNVAGMLLMHDNDRIIMWNRVVGWSILWPIYWFLVASVRVYLLVLRVYLLVLRVYFGKEKADEIKREAGIE